MDWHPKPLDPADVTVHRRGRGKPLVLLHCLGMDWRFWDVLEPLADQFELIAYSFPGHHDTALPKGQYDEAGLGDQLKALMKREGLARAHLAGISMGGSLAQHFAGTYPEMVDRVILCDCTPHYNDEMRANWPVRAALARKNGVASLIPMLEKVFFTQAIARRERAQRPSCEGKVGGLQWRGLRTGLRMAGDARRPRAGKTHEDADAGPARRQRGAALQGCGAVDERQHPRQQRHRRSPDGRPCFGPRAARIRAPAVPPISRLTGPRDSRRGS